MRPSLAFCPLFIMRIQSTLPWPGVSVVSEIFKNDETEAEKCTLTIKAYGARIRQLRKRRELTQEQLAEKLNVSGTYIVKIESNQRTGSVEFAVELAHCFGVSLDYLLLGTACNDKRTVLKTVIAFLSELEASFES